MPLLIVRNDITTMAVDAIVNAANNTLLGGGGVDGAIHRAAGPKLLDECRTLGGCITGEAKITKGYNLPAKYVIHTVGPIWYGGERGEESLLRLCYRNSLELAVKYECESVAFPLISGGVYGCPPEETLRIGCEVIREFLELHELTVYMVVFDRGSLAAANPMFASIASYIDDNYVDAHAVSRESVPMPCYAPAPDFARTEATVRNTLPDMSRCIGASAVSEKQKKKSLFKRKSEDIIDESCDVVQGMAMSLDDAVASIDESFAEMLLRKIDERGMTDAECYKKANIDRKLFSKIRSDRLYKPSKTTAIAFAIALELPIDEAKDMLMKAGFALSHSNKFDIIIEYFITNGNYDVFAINEALFSFDQALLGA